jgi:hypothetical protein
VRGSDLQLRYYPTEFAKFNFKTSKYYDTWYIMLDDVLIEIVQDGKKNSLLQRAAYCRRNGSVIVIAS